MTKIKINYLQEIQSIFMPEVKYSKLGIYLTSKEYLFFDIGEQPNIVWLDKKGINTPYLLEVIGG